MKRLKQAFYSFSHRYMYAEIYVRACERASVCVCVWVCMCVCCLCVCVCVCVVCVVYGVWSVYVMTPCVLQIRVSQVSVTQTSVLNVHVLYIQGADDA